MAFVALLDACVLVPASLRDTLLRAADAGFYSVVWSEDILVEVERHVARLTSPPSQIAARRLIQVLRRNFPEAETDRARYQPLIENMTNHPKDRHVLAAAVASGAQVIVTANIKDFPKKSVAAYGIETQTPDEFLLNLWNLNAAYWRPSCVSRHQR